MKQPKPRKKQKYPELYQFDDGSIYIVYPDEKEEFFFDFKHGWNEPFLPLPREELINSDIVTFIGEIK